MHHRKDASLDKLAERGNVAQFVSYEPTSQGGRQTFSRVRGFGPNHLFASIDSAVEHLLRNAPDGSVNVRSFMPDSPRSREFVYGLVDPGDAAAALRRLMDEGLHVIVNETVDVTDGGVSGVVQGDIIEFAPDDTPRCVEKPGVASLPIQLGMALLSCVYGFAPDVPLAAGRVEFSVHPRPRGWRDTQTILWELEEEAAPSPLPHMRWPNRFSRHIGDKAYGLLMADLTGLKVPRTLVIPRRVAPFAFGRATGLAETWLRTCPTEQEPGLYTTCKGWIDPFKLIEREDAAQCRIASVLSQAAVAARHSGAALVNAEGTVVIEGVAGEGDRFMLGSQPHADLPSRVVQDVRSIVEQLSPTFGPTRIEWVHDGQQAWVVQLHVGASVSTATVVVPGEPGSWIDFDVSDGLERLRSLLDRTDSLSGISLHGRVGMTSHIADLLRKAGRPARIAPGKTAMAD